jgi:hypothetical protein
VRFSAGQIVLAKCKSALVRNLAGKNAGRKDLPTAVVTQFEKKRALYKTILVGGR